MLEKITVHQHKVGPCANDGCGCKVSDSQEKGFTPVCVPDSDGGKLCVHLHGDIADADPIQLFKHAMGFVVQVLRQSRGELAGTYGTIVASPLGSTGILAEHSNHTHGTVAQTGGACSAVYHHPSCETAFPSSQGWTETNCGGSNDFYTCTHVVMRPGAAESSEPPSEE